MIRITRFEYLKALDVIHRYKLQLEEDYAALMEESHMIGIYPDTLLSEVEGLTRRLKVAVYWALDHADLLPNDVRYDDCIKTVKIKDLENISLTQIKKFRNTGNSTINELKTLCFYAGVQLKK